jgi:hypothetical protein
MQDSLQVGFSSQAVQVACDFACNLCMRGVPRNDAVVPFIIHASDLIQFGVVYVLENNFPCPMYLSLPLSLLDFENSVDIAKWIVVLNKFCAKMKGLLDGLLNEKKIIKLNSDYVGNQGELKLTNIFIKPVRGEVKFVNSIKSRFFFLLLLI